MKKLLLLLVVVLAGCSTNPTSKDQAESDSKLSLSIEGMVCEHGCVSAINDKMKATLGVTAVNIDFKTQTAEIEFDKDILNSDQIIQEIEGVNNGAYKTSNVKVICLKDCESESDNTIGQPSSESSSLPEPEVSLNGFRLPNIFSLLNALLR